MDDVANVANQRHAKRPCNWGTLPLRSDNSRLYATYGLDKLPPVATDAKDRLDLYFLSFLNIFRSP